MSLNYLKKCFWHGIAEAWQGTRCRSYFYIMLQAWIRNRRRQMQPLSSLHTIGMSLPGDILLYI